VSRVGERVGEGEECERVAEEGGGAVEDGERRDREGKRVNRRGGELRGKLEGGGGLGEA